MSICGKLSDPISFNVAIIVAIDLIQQNTFPSGKVTRRRLCLVLCRSASFSSIAKYFIYWCLLKKSFNDICPSLRTICTNHIRLCASCTLSDPASNLSTICQQAISRKFTRVSRISRPSLWERGRGWGPVGSFFCLQQALSENSVLNILLMLEDEASNDSTQQGC